MKICTKCKGNPQPLTAFSKQKNRLRSQCNSCNASDTALYRSKNKDKLKIKGAEYRALNRDVLCARKSEFYQKNKEKITIKNIAYGKAHPEKGRMRSAAWSKANPEYARARTIAYRARKLNAFGRHTADDVKNIFVSQRGKCPACKARIDDGYHVDHVFPLVKGGGNGKDNIQLLCAKCNHEKHAKDPLIFMQSKGFLI